jgi:hypothetical protein
MKSDQSLLAILIGALATISDEIFTRILVLSGIGKYSVYELASLITTLNRPNYILGIILSSEAGGMIALVFYYYLRKLGSKKLVIKGLLMGLLAWTFLELLFTWLIEGRKLIPFRPISDYYIQMFGALLWSLVMGLLFKRYIFKNKPI